MCANQSWHAHKELHRSFINVFHSIMNNSIPLISILVPVYNVERFLSSALNSIAAQSYNNIEVIIIDDCSSDSTADIAADFCARDSRFRLFRNKNNLQIAESLNKALVESNGQFIARCDGDDIMAYDRIEKQLEYLRNNPEISLVGCSAIAIDEDDNKIRKFDYPSGSHLLKKLLPYWSPVSHIWLATRELYDRLGGYRLQTVEDYDFLLRANINGYKFDNIPNYYGMKIRIRRGNTVSTYGIAQRRLFNYAKKINKKGTVNNFSKDFVDQTINKKSSGFLGRMHYLSDLLSHKAGVSKSDFTRILFHFFSAFCSPYKAQYYFNCIVKQMIIYKHNISR